MNTPTPREQALPVNKLLILEPDTSALNRLIAVFEPEGYAINSAATGPQFLAMAALVVPDLIVFGASLADKEYADNCQQIRIDPLLQDVPMVCMTTKDDAAARLRALEIGADDVFGEMANPAEIRARVRNIIQQDRPRKLAEQRLEYERVQGEMEAALEAILEKWAFSQEMAGLEAVGHTRRVADLTVAVAREMKVSEDEISLLRRGAILHDIGKTSNGVDDVLGWDQMTSEEKESARQHPLRAEELLWSIPLLRPALAIPLYHHERWDGTGYPSGLHGEAIPLAARIFAVVDVWDELCAGHPNRPPWQPLQALAYIRAQSNKWFDPAVAEAFLKLQERTPSLPLQPLPRKPSPKHKRVKRKYKLLEAFSLARRGAWAQLAVAALLITVLPMLCLIWLWQQDMKGEGLPATVSAGVCVVTLAIMISGYAVLGKYPLNIVRLRNYLQTLASGEMPVRIRLSPDTDDLTAMQQYMTDIVRQAADRIRVIKDQQDRLLHTERQRVMVESLAALCHHLGQPATMIATYLYMLQQQVETPELKKTVAECQQAFNDMQDILNRLQRVVVYRTEPYLGQDGDKASLQGRMVEV